jgi:hypothetical protein
MSYEGRDVVLDGMVESLDRPFTMILRTLLEWF